jgi:hypothetical protein
MTSLTIVGHIPFLTLNHNLDISGTKGSLVTKLHHWIQREILTQKMALSKFFHHTPFLTFNPNLDISETKGSLVTKLPSLDSA